MQAAAASDVAHGVAASISITAGRLVHARALHALQDHMVTTITLMTAYAGLSLLAGRAFVLRVGRDVAAVAMTRAIMLYALSLQADRSHEVALLVVGASLVAASDVLQQLHPVFEPVFLGVQYAFADLIQQTSVFQNRDTRLLLSAVLLAASALAAKSPHKYPFQSTLVLTGVSYFVLQALTPTEAGIPLDDVVLGAASVSAAYVLLGILPEAGGAVHSYVVSSLAQRISETLAAVYGIQWWVILVYDALAYAVLVPRLAGGAAALVGSVLSMVAVTQILSVGLPAQQGVAFQFYDELFLVLCGIVTVHFAVEAFPGAHQKDS